MKPAAVVLTVPDGQDSPEVDNDSFHTLKKKVRFQRWTEIAEGDASTASGLVKCEAWEDENWLYWPGTSETAGTRDQEWWGWYLVDKDCLLCKKGGQFWS